MSQTQLGSCFLLRGLNFLPSSCGCLKLTFALSINFTCSLKRWQRVPIYRSLHFPLQPSSKHKSPTRLEENLKLRGNITSHSDTSHATQGSFLQDPADGPTSLTSALPKTESSVLGRLIKSDCKPFFFLGLNWISSSVFWDSYRLCSFPEHYGLHPHTGCSELFWRQLCWPNQVLSFCFCSFPSC